MNILHLFLAAFFTFVALFYTALILKKHRKQKPVVTMGVPYSCHWWNHLTFKVFRTAIWFVCIAIVFSPTLFDYLVPFHFLILPEIAWSGAVLLVLGFIIAMLANLTLGNQWRSGIMQNPDLQLVCHGVYSVSRNPAFIGVALGQLGFFLALPCLFSLICLIVGSMALRTQIHLEEKHLLHCHPKQYPSYQKMVPRWL